MHSITSYIHTKTTIDFFSTTDGTDGTDFIKADLHFLFLNTFTLFAKEKSVTSAESVGNK